MNKIYEDSLKELIKIIESVINEKGVVVYLFGSRATGKATSSSDIDIGILYTQDRNLSKRLTILREMIEISNIPYLVDVVDLSKVSESFRDKV